VQPGFVDLGCIKRHYHDQYVPSSKFVQTRLVGMGCIRSRVHEEFVQSRRVGMGRIKSLYDVPHV